MGAISESKAAFELVREIAAYLKKAGEHDPKLMGMFEELRVKVLSLYESDVELRQHVLELEEKLKLREDVFFDRKKGAYYTGTPQDIKDGPFCSRCYHAGKGLVPMEEWEDSGFTFDEDAPTTPKWLCTSCSHEILR